MRLHSRQVLTLLCTRASSLLTTGGETAAPSCDAFTIRYVSGVSSSLVSLSCTTRDTQLHQCALQWVERLSSQLKHFPEGAPLVDEVVVNIFRVVKNSMRSSNGSWGEGSVPSLCINGLLLGLDERLTGMQFASWRPQAVLYSLQAIAMTECARQLGMTNLLFYCAKEHLQQFDENRVARLLWCVAKLQQEEAQAVLWKLACRRLLRLYPKLKAPSRALVLESLLLTHGCTCEAQQQLLCLLHEDMSSNRESGEHHDSEGEYPATALMDIEGEYHVLKARLLSQVHHLPVGTLIAMLRGGSGQLSPCSPHSGGATTADTETTYYLLKHLIRRPLDGAACREVLEVIASFEPTDLTESLRRHVLDCVSSKRSTATSVGNNPAQLLEVICLAVVLERQQVRNVGEELLSLLHSLIIECYSMRDAPLRRCCGRLAGLLSVALDVFTACRGKIDPMDPAITECSSIIAKFPEVWEQNGVVVTSTVSECITAVRVICELLRVPPLLRVVTESATSPTIVSSEGNSTDGHSGSLGSRQKLVEPLLERCAKCLHRDNVLVPASAVFDTWQHVARVSSSSAIIGGPVSRLGGGGKHDALQQIVTELFTYTEKRPSEFPLREIAKFLGASSHPLPMEAYDLFIRCLKNERKNVSAHYLELLLSSLEEVSARGDKVVLERLLLSLFVRSLGHDDAFAHTAPFTARQFVRLFHCCTNLTLNAAASMRATLLQRMTVACSEAAGIDDLNAVASLLPLLQQGAQRDALAAALVARGKVLNPATMSDVQKALLLVYLYKAGVPIDDGLTDAFRRRA